MTIHITNPRVTRLAAQLAALTGESRTEAVRMALEERLARLSTAAAQKRRRAELARVLGCGVTPMVRAGNRSTSLTPEEVQELLAYGP